MEIKIMASGSVTLTPELKKFIDDKAQKVTELVPAGDTAALMEVEVGTVGHKSGEIQRAEINLQVAGAMIRTEAVRATLHAAIDEAMSEARRKLRKTKGKQRNLVRDGAAQVKEFFRRFKA